jgi:predicted DNA-binding transcriptional regulator AlpA
VSTGCSCPEGDDTEAAHDAQAERRQEALGAAWHDEHGTVLWMVLANRPTEDVHPWVREAVTRSALLRTRDLASYLGVSYQRVKQMGTEGELPEPDQVDGVGPQWERAAIERWAEREWWGTRRWRKR